MTSMQKWSVLIQNSPKIELGTMDTSTDAILSTQQKRYSDDMVTNVSIRQLEEDEAVKKKKVVTFGKGKKALKGTTMKYAIWNTATVLPAVWSPLYGGSESFQADRILLQAPVSNLLSR